MSEPCPYFKCFPPSLDLLVVRPSWECNSRCSHCAAWTLYPLGVTSSLTPDMLMKCLNNINDLLPAQEVSIYGGEPFIHKDICTLIEICSTAASRIDIISNGSLAANHINLLSKHANKIKVTLSIEGPMHINDAIRGTGSFDKVMLASNKLLHAGVAFGFRVTCHFKNHKFLTRSFIRFLRDTGGSEVSFHSHYFNYKWLEAVINNTNTDLIAWAKEYSHFGSGKKQKTNYMDELKEYFSYGNDSDLVHFEHKFPPSFNNGRCSFASCCPSANELVIQPSGVFTRCRYLPATSHSIALQ